MTQMPVLLEELAHLDGRPVETLTHIMRTLRASGQVETGRRGLRSHVSSKSAANLLLALMSGAQPADTPKAVAAYGSLKPMRCSLPHKACFRSIQEVAEAETLTGALVVLIERAPALKRAATTLLAMAYNNLGPEDLTERSIDLLFSVELTISRPAPNATLTLRSPNDLGLEVTEFEHQWVMDAKLMQQGFYADQFKAATDLRTQTTITHRSIFRIGDLLAADSTEEHDDETTRIEGEASPESRGDAGDARQGGSGKPRSIGYRESGLRLPAR
jgi:hypothetical protein